MKKDIIGIKEIMALIPHRYPLLLIDRILEINESSIVGLKNVSMNEPQFLGHFPGEPVMPGVMIVEAMAQVSAVLVASSMESTEDKQVYFMSIEAAKFRKTVEPGDSMILHSRIDQSRSHVWKFSARAEVGGDIVAESKFTAMVKSKS